MGVVRRRFRRFVQRFDRLGRVCVTTLRIGFLLANQKLRDAACDNETAEISPGDWRFQFEASAKISGLGLCS